MFSFPYVNTLTWADILFQKLRLKTENQFEKHPLHYFVLLYGGVDPSTILSELHAYFSLFWCKRVLWYALHNIPSH